MFSEELVGVQNSKRDPPTGAPAGSSALEKKMRKIMKVSP